VFVTERVGDLFPLSKICGKAPCVCRHEVNLDVRRGGKSDPSAAAIDQFTGVKLWCRQPSLEKKYGKLGLRTSCLLCFTFLCRDKAGGCVSLLPTFSKKSRERGYRQRATPWLILPVVICQMLSGAVVRCSVSRRSMLSGAVVRCY
jgi:hypothetical protein